MTEKRAYDDEAAIKLCAAYWPAREIAAVIGISHKYCYQYLRSLGCDTQRTKRLVDAMSRVLRAPDVDTVAMAEAEVGRPIKPPRAAHVPRSQRTSQRRKAQRAAEAAKRDEVRSAAEEQALERARKASEATAAVVLQRKPRGWRTKPKRRSRGLSPEEAAERILEAAAGARTRSATAPATIEEEWTEEMDVELADTNGRGVWLANLSRRWGVPVARLRARYMIVRGQVRV